MFGATTTGQAYSDSDGGYFTQYLFSQGKSDFKNYFRELARVCQRNHGCFMITAWNGVIRVCELDENM